MGNQYEQAEILLTPRRIGAVLLTLCGFVFAVSGMLYTGRAI